VEEGEKSKITKLVLGIIPEGTTSLQSQIIERYPTPNNPQKSSISFVLGTV
jgi:hypothetical protein